MMNSGDYNFSFSGLKTAVLYLVQDLQKKYGKRLPTYIRNEICAEFQQSVIDVLTIKTIKAAKKYKAKTIIIGGGVASNVELRRQLAETLRHSSGQEITLRMPTPALSLDNAAMIAAAAYFNWKKGNPSTSLDRARDKSLRARRSSWRNIKIKL